MKVRHFGSASQRASSGGARALDLARALHRDIYLDRDINHQDQILNAISVEQWQAFARRVSQQSEETKDKSITHRLKLLQAHQPTFFPAARMIGLPMFWRRFLLTCFAVIRQHDPKLITPYLKTLESLIQLLIDREEGRVQAWEGIRVVRTHRV